MDSGNLEMEDTGVYTDDNGDILIVVGGTESNAVDAHGMRSLFSALPEVNVVYFRLQRKIHSKLTSRFQRRNTVL